MAKKRAARRDASTAKPKQLRKRLRKAEDQLSDAVTKRDRAQARVDALSIIADEIRAQLAEVAKADSEKKAKTDKAKADKAKARSGVTDPKSGPSKAKSATAKNGRGQTTGTRKPAAAKKPVAAAAPPAARKTAAARKSAASTPAAARKSAAVATTSDTATTRRKPAAQERASEPRPVD